MARIVLPSGGFSPVLGDHDRSVLEVRAAWAGEQIVAWRGSWRVCGKTAWLRRSLFSIYMQNAGSLHGSTGGSSNASDFWAGNGAISRVGRSMR